MLELDANAIAHEAFASTLGLLEKEMNVVLQHIGNLGTQGALIAGFVFSLFLDDVIFGEDYGVLFTLAMVSATMSFGSMLYVVVCSTLTSSLGPMMALKGSDSTAMRRAVEMMKKDWRRIVFAFSIGVSSFELLSLVLVWNRLIDHWYSALICSCIMAIAAGSLAISVRRIVRQYHIDDTVDATPTLGGGGATQVSGREYLKRAQKAKEASVTETFSS